MLRIAFCDDDLSALNEIREFLDQYRQESKREIMCLFFHSPLELMNEIEKGLRLDILVLDIIMPGENGVNVAREIRQYDDTVKLIFLTSSSEFAVESYTVGAYFYQMKPICWEDFSGLLDSAIAEYEYKRQSSLVLRCKSGITRVNLENLVYCEVIGRTLLFHLKGEKVLESVGSMNELCSKLAGFQNFLHPHRSFLINMEYIQNISCRAITLDNSVEIPIPHGKCSEIRNRYLEYASSREQVCML